jgi:hypothetical protein
MAGRKRAALLEDVFASCDLSVPPTARFTKVLQQGGQPGNGPVPLTVILMVRDTLLHQPRGL